MKKSFREYHLLKILHLFDSSTLPLDLFLRNYFRENKAIGSNDRKEICEKLFALIRWKGLIDHFCSPKPSWEERSGRLSEILQKKEYLNPSLPPHIRVSLPKWYFDHLKENYSEEKALAFGLMSNVEAPVTVRVNLLKTTREALFDKWKELYPIRLAKHSASGIIFEKRINFFTLDEFKEGLFEVQDEASQLAADLVEALPGSHVLDYCAGSGGKTLAFAPKMQGKGQIYLHDIRPHVLLEAKKRLKRAGIQNAQILMPDSKNLSSLHQTMDFVVVDAPCSGSGTLRRNPDMKWKFTKEKLENLLLEQRAIVEKALSFVKKKGKLIYMTCSVFLEENAQQIAYFEKNFSLKTLSPPFQSFPEEKGMDGFFAAVLERQ